MKTFCIDSHSVEETEQIASSLSPLLRLGDIIVLTGDLACGKTHFVKFLSHALGTKEIVTSPTFNIANFYKIAKGYLLHIDAYRLTNVSEFRSLGLLEFMPQSITIIEWGEIIATDFKDYLIISFEFTQDDEHCRKLTFSSVGERWADMARLKSKLT